MGRKFDEFIQRMYGNSEMDEEDLQTIDNLSQISEPLNFTREKFHDKVEETFGTDILDSHDKKEIGYMTKRAKDHIPPDIASGMDDDFMTEIEKEALERSKEYHPAVLAMGVSDALYNAADHRVPPGLILPETVPSAAFELADMVTDNGESYEDSESESDDDFGFDDDDEDFD